MVRVRVSVLSLYIALIFFDMLNAALHLSKIKYDQFAELHLSHFYRCSLVHCSYVFFDTFSAALHLSLCLFFRRMLFAG